MLGSMAQGPWYVLEFRLPEPKSNVISTIALRPHMFITQFNDNDGIILTPWPRVSNMITAFNGYIITHFLGTNHDACFKNEYFFSYT